MSSLRSIRNSTASRTLGAAACLALGAATPAAAHGFGQRYDLPLPLPLYLFGAAAVPSPYDASWLLNRISDVESMPRR